MTDELARYAQLKMEMLEIQDELRLLEETLTRQVREQGPLQGHGFKATMKPGRKKIDHMQASIDNEAPEGLIKKYTTVETSVKWAQVTKAMALDLAEYTEQSMETLEIKPIWG